MLLKKFFLELLMESDFKKTLALSAKSMCKDVDDFI